MAPADRTRYRRVPEPAQADHSESLVELSGRDAERHEDVLPPGATVRLPPHCERDDVVVVGVHGLAPRSSRVEIVDRWFCFCVAERPVAKRDRRSDSVSPPHTPCRSSCSSAYVRHSTRTGHRSQIFFAACSRRIRSPQVRVRCGKNMSVADARHRAEACQVASDIRRTAGMTSRCAVTAGMNPS